MVPSEARWAAAGVALALKVVASTAVLARVFGQALMAPATPEEKGVKIYGGAIDQAGVAVDAYRRAKAGRHDRILPP